MQSSFEMMRDMKLLLFVLLHLLLYVRTNLLQRKIDSSNNGRKKFWFWEVLDLLQNKNDIDIQNIIMVSYQPNCECEDTTCDLVRTEIIQNNYMIPYRCIFLLDKNYGANVTNSFNNILTTTKPSLVLLTGPENLMLTTVIPKATSFLTSNHIWMVLHTFSDELKVTQKMELNLTMLRSLEQLKYDSKIFIWKVNSIKGYFWEIYRFCSKGFIKTQHLLTLEKSGLVENNFRYIWERRKDLSQCEIRIGYINSYPYMYDKNAVTKTEPITNAKMCFFKSNMTMCGNYVPLLKLLTQQLNFTIRWTHAKDNGFGVIDSVSSKWNGLLGLLVNNEADISPCWHFITSSRTNDMDFSSPISKYGGHLYMKRPHVTASWGTYFNVFDGTYWLVLAILSGLISILLCVFFAFVCEINISSQKDTNLYWKILSYFTSGIAMVCLSLGGQDVSVAVPQNIKTSKSLKILFFVTCVFGVMNFYIYNSSLISLLTIEKYDLPINNMEDFISKPDYQLMVMSGDGLESYFRLSDDLVRKKIWKANLENNPKAYVSSTAEGENTLMRNSKRVLFLTPDSATGFSHYPCEITRATKEFAKYSVGYGFKKNSPFVGVFSYIINDLVEFGNVKYIQSAIAMEKDSLTCEENKEYRPLGYENIFSVFILFFIGIIFSCIKLLLELINCKHFLN